MYVRLYVIGEIHVADTLRLTIAIMDTTPISATIVLAFHLLTITVLTTFAIAMCVLASVCFCDLSCSNLLSSNRFKPSTINRVAWRPWAWMKLLS